LGNGKRRGKFEALKVSAVYLAALIFGLGVLLLQFVFPGHGVDADGDAAQDADHPHSSSLPVYLSLRFWTFGLLAFGMVGSLLRLLALASDTATFVLALVMGLASGGLSAWTFIALKRAEATSGVDAREAAGHLGRIVLACGRQQKGKVRIQLGGTTLDLIATTDEELLEHGTHVLIEEVRGTTAHVSRAPDLLVPDST
jgi:membrane protein implicated in regulation of membrane protease activity